MKLASIEKIISVAPHPNADKLELVRVLGWQAIVPKGQFKAGDSVVFITIDTILPYTDWSSFLADKEHPQKPIRLKTVKLRGEYSQGLILPLSILPENVRMWQIGADISGFLNVKKHVKEIPAKLSGQIRGAFPTFICAQTDEENAASNLDLVREVFKSKSLTITKKYDGASCTIIINDGEVERVCSRRMELEDSSNNSFWRVAKEINLFQVNDDEQLIIQGELMGPGIQGNQLKLSKPELFVFQIRTKNGFLPYPEMKAKSEQMGLKVVPLLQYIEINGSLEGELSKLQELADSLFLDDKNNLAEGIVVRPSNYPSCGSGRPLGFKIINRNYKD